MWVGGGVRGRKGAGGLRFHGLHALVVSDGVGDGDGEALCFW